MNKTPISLDSLIEKMKERGCTSAQLKSNTIPTVLSIIAESDGEYTDLIAIREEINKLKKEKQELDMQVGKRSEELQKLHKESEHLKWQIYHEGADYIVKFFKALDECETPTGRDAIKAAQMFVNSVEVNTKYDNTAYIAGLAAILSQGQIAPLEELKKINPSIPKINVEASTWSRPYPTARLSGSMSLEEYNRRYGEKNGETDGTNDTEN